MGSHTLKIGSKVSVKNTSIKGEITNIENGQIKIGRSKTFYLPSQVIGDKVTPEKKQRARISPVSPQQKTLNAIYSIIRPRFLSHNKLCRARFAGCTHKSTEIHHMYSRTGFWLIIMKYMFPICRSCHRYATKHSKEAIAAGVSIPRTASIEYEFNKYELSLMARNGLNAP